MQMSDPATWVRKYGARAVAPEQFGALQGSR
jgi:hypothetical protein